MIQAAFLDRDGVINEDVPLIHRPEQLVLLPGAARAIRRLNDAGVLVIVVTNQPVVARNLCTEEELARIHDRLRELLRDAAEAKLDAIYACPHHPETHHPDGNPVYRVSCACRKPKPGMIFRARDDFGLDLARCVLIGDHARDILAGRAAGVRTILVRKLAAADEALASGPDLVVASLEEAVGQALAPSPS